MFHRSGHHISVTQGASATVPTILNIKLVRPSVTRYFWDLYLSLASSDDDDDGRKGLANSNSFRDTTIPAQVCDSSLGFVVTGNETDDDGNDSIEIAEAMDFVTAATPFQQFL